MHSIEALTSHATPTLSNGAGMDLSVRNVNGVPYVFGNCAAIVDDIKSSRRLEFVNASRWRPCWSCSFCYRSTPMRYFHTLYPRGLLDSIKATQLLRWLLTRIRSSLTTRGHLCSVVRYTLGESRVVNPCGAMFLRRWRYGWRSSLLSSTQSLLPVNRPQASTQSQFITIGVFPRESKANWTSNIIGHKLTCMRLLKKLACLLYRDLV